MQTILVTGCNGFIGSHLTEALVNKGLTVIGADLSPYPWDDNYRAVQQADNFFQITGDLVDEQFVREIVADTKPDIIYHLASVVGVKHYLSDPLRVIDVNVISTRNLIKAVQKLKCKLVYASTSEIYGKNPRVPWGEDESDRVLGPTTVDRWAYSSSKAVAEHMLMAAHKSYHIPVTVVRFFNVYGPRQRPDLVVPVMVRGVLAGRPVPLYDGGRQTRCFTFVEDVVQGAILAGTVPEAAGHVFNLGRSVETTIQELFNEIKARLEPEYNATAQIIDTKSAFGSAYQDIPRRVPDVRKARKILGWEAATPLSEGISKTIKWWKNVIK